MKIIDISHWQGNIDFDKVEKDNIDAVIMKATQGVSMVDDKFATNKKNARKEGLLCGFYHFADGSDYKKEADHFVATIGELQEGEFVALDFEIDIANPAEWCKNWLDRVSSKLGFKPLLYTNEARVKSIDFKAVAAANYGLWVAKFGDNDDKAEDNEIPNTDEWAFYAIWQYSSKGKVDGIAGNVDLDTTTMDLATLKKYGKPKTVTPAPDQTIESLVKQNAELTKQVSFYKTTGENQDVIISDLKKELANKETTIDELNKTIAEKATAIADLVKDAGELGIKLNEQKIYCDQIFTDREKLRAENETLKANEAQTNAEAKSFLQKLLSMFK
jgi:GH25 family lysozyme M1 (1,4-beta-N-acetylmuramidase)